MYQFLLQPASSSDPQDRRPRWVEIGWCGNRSRVVFIIALNNRWERPIACKRCVWLTIRIFAQEHCRNHSSLNFATVDLVCEPSILKRNQSSLLEDIPLKNHCNGRIHCRTDMLGETVWQRCIMAPKSYYNCTLGWFGAVCSYYWLVPLVSSRSCSVCLFSTCRTSLLEMLISSESALQ